MALLKEVSDCTNAANANSKNLRSSDQKLLIRINESIPLIMNRNVSDTQKIKDIMNLLTDAWLKEYSHKPLLVRHKSYSMDFINKINDNPSKNALAIGIGLILNEHSNKIDPTKVSPALLSRIERPKTKEFEPFLNPREKMEAQKNPQSQSQPSVQSSKKL